jgi:hypothetical protein
MVGVKRVKMVGVKDAYISIYMYIYIHTYIYIYTYVNIYIHMSLPTCKAVIVESNKKSISCFLSFKVS